jgi:hypothetical protein
VLKRVFGKYKVGGISRGKPWELFELSPEEQG